MNFALIFAGGVGRRMNTKAKPKQFLEIHGKPIIIYTIEHFENHPKVDKICVVIVKEWIDIMRKLVEKYHLEKVEWIIPGDDTAIKSQYAGLKTIESSEEYTEDSIVLIHDGVRPLIDGATISKCIESVRNYGSAITVAPAIETIVRVDAKQRITDTVLREECQLARAPQAFYTKKIIEVHEKAQKEKINSFIDSVSMMTYYGEIVYTVEGPSENIKVTTPADFHICRALLDAREDSQIYGV